MNWIDLAALAFLAFSAWNGYRRGVIDELSGFLAFVAAIVAGLNYGGQFDGAAASLAHLGPGSSHVAGLLAFASCAYLVVWAAGFALDRIAKLPLLSVVNGALGGVVAVAKTLLVLVVLDYAATLVPMSEDLRADVARSAAGRTLGDVDAAIDDGLGSHLPDYLRPLFAAVMHRRPEVAPDPAASEGTSAP